MLSRCVHQVHLEGAHRGLGSAVREDPLPYDHPGTLDGTGIDGIAEANAKTTSAPGIGDEVLTTTIENQHIENGVIPLRCDEATQLLSQFLLGISLLLLIELIVLPEGGDEGADQADLFTSVAIDLVGNRSQR